MLEAEQTSRAGKSLRERIPLGFGMIWTALVAVRILRQARSSTTTSREPSP